jgi:hypothetical protein
VAGAACAISVNRSIEFLNASCPALDQHVPVIAYLISERPRGKGCRAATARNRPPGNKKTVDNSPTGSLHRCGNHANLSIPDAGFNRKCVVRGRYDIATAPRDGTVVRVGADSEWYEMRWHQFDADELVETDDDGVWEAVDRSFRWSEADGFGPTHWLPCFYVVQPVEEIPASSGTRRRRIGR